MTKNSEITSTDIAQISDVVQLYFEGTHFSDGDKMEQAFAPGCQIIGKTMREERDDWIESVRNRESPDSKGAPFDYSIDSIQVDGDIAVARLNVPINGMQFTDVMTLLRLDEGWRAVAKAFFRHPDA